MQPDARFSFDWPPRYDFFETTRLLRTGRNDPTLRREADGLWRCARLPQGPVTVQLRIHPEQRIDARVWGDGARAAAPHLRRWLGLDEPPWSLPAHPVTDRLLRMHSGVRLTDCGDVFEALLNIILQQQITWNEAAFHWRRLAEALGEPAPGPAGLQLPPTPAALRAAGVEEIMAVGISRQRARTLVEVAFSGARLQRVAALSTDAALALLQSIRGVGPWTAAFALGLRLGRPDPVVLGDLGLPHAASWAFAREPRGSDARMQALLAPFDGQTFRVIRLLFAARIQAPRRSPRREVIFRKF